MAKEQVKKYAGLVGNQNARAEDPKVKKVTVRFTEEEFERVGADAKARGKNIAQYIRDRVAFDY